MSKFESNKIMEKKEAWAISKLADFDEEYFKELEGEDGWNALGMENCRNQRYFTVLNPDKIKLGIIGVYDTVDEENISHTIVDPEFRGKGLARKFKEALMDKLNLPFMTMTIDLNNQPSLRAAEKLPNLRKVSDEAYEREFHKAKYIFERPGKRDNS